MTPDERMRLFVLVSEYDIAPGSGIEELNAIAEFVEALEHNAHTRGLNDYAEMLRDASTKAATNQDKDA